MVDFGRHDRINNGYVKTKWHEIYCPYEDTKVKVQGTWELKYAKYLNENNILWTRPSEPINYKLFDNDYNHSYFPHFYLIEFNEYVEIKGYWWKSKDGRVDDKRKMVCVIEQNPNKNIIIIDDIKIFSFQK